MNKTIREIREQEYPLLKDFLYEAIFIPEGAEAPPKAIVNAPELQVYVCGFGGQEADFALVAEVDGKVIGAVWARIMEDYGHVDAQTPSLAIALFKAYRGLGIGTELMRAMLSSLAKKGWGRSPCLSRSLMARSGFTSALALRWQTKTARSTSW